MPVVAQSFWEPEFLDQYEIPVGEWVQDGIHWVVNNLRWLLDAIRWPVEQLLTQLNDNILQVVPWPVVILFVVVLGALTRGLKVGVFSGVGLIACGLLGEGYWSQTMLTIAMIVTAVLICVAIGLPVGIAAGRSDRISAMIRPGLDAMQTIHPFVWLVPVVFFWGTREVPGVIATVIFALPPMVRLTDLGIRQVPEDVVEAARAYGSSERRLLFDVQLPLARPSIMAGLNQTLMLALSMVVIAALLAASGLGQEILRGVQSANIPRAVSGGVAVLIVAMVLDRLSQPPRSKGDGPAAPSPLKRLLGRGAQLRSSRSPEATTAE